MNKHIRPISNDERATIRRLVHVALSDGEPVVQDFVPQTKRQKSLLPKVPGVRHFAIKEHLGFNPSLTCWCSSSLELDYSHGYEEMTERLNAFCTEHAECLPPGSEDT